MSVRSIRGIERTAVYTPVQAASAYAHYPQRGGEPQLPADDSHEWTRTFRQAAGSAAEWLQAAGRAQRMMDELTWELSRALRGGFPVDVSLRKLADTLNRLEADYQKHASALKPELWAAVELALRHPASDALGLHRSAADGAWTIGSALAVQSSGVTELSGQHVERGFERLLKSLQNAELSRPLSGPCAEQSSDGKPLSGLSVKQNREQAWSLEQDPEFDKDLNQWPTLNLVKRLEQGLLREQWVDPNWRLAQSQETSAQRDHIKKLMLGTDGILNGIKTALTYSNQLRTIDLVQTRFTGTLPYTVYYGAMQSSWPLPYTGLILNRYI